MANRKLEKVIPSFRFCPTVKIENSNLKILEKISEISQVFPGFRVFDLVIQSAPLLLTQNFRQKNVTDFFVVSYWVCYYFSIIQ